METLEQTEEKILIHESTEDIIRITNEVQQRRDLLNTILATGLTAKEIKNITTSLDSITKYIFHKQIDSNKKLKELINAGIQGISAELPQELESLRYSLTAWFNYPTSRRGGDKYQHLVYVDDKFEMDVNSLEETFVASSLKVFISGDLLEEYREVEALIQFIEKYEMPSGQVVASPFLNSRIKPVGRNKFQARWQFFTERGRN